MDGLQKLKKNGISLSQKDIIEICTKYEIRELSLFGSSIRDDFQKDSDIDFLVSFFENADISLFDIIDLQNELSKNLNREIDIVEKESLKNPIRKKNILDNREIIYVA